MKRLFNAFMCTALLAAVLCGCEKIDDGKKIDLDKLEGTWYEQYDPALFALDGSVIWSFAADGKLEKQVSDVFSGTTRKYEGTYSVDAAKGTVTVSYEGAGATEFEIVTMTSKEMEWQKAGTTYSAGTWHSDYLHFVK